MAHSPQVGDEEASPVAEVHADAAFVEHSEPHVFECAWETRVSNYVVVEIKDEGKCVVRE